MKWFFKRQVRPSGPAPVVRPALREIVQATEETLDRAAEYHLEAEVMAATLMMVADGRPIFEALDLALSTWDV